MGVRRIDSAFLYLFAILTFSLACGEKEAAKKADQDSPVAGTIASPDFSADTAYYFIERQVKFGPRVPNTDAHAKCADYLENTLKKYASSVFVQKGNVEAFDGKNLSIRNIIASFAPEKKNRILLCAHWDTRPFADQDTERQGEPIDGANDGGSGVGVLLEIARLLSQHEPPVGVDIIFFDAEDYGQPDNDTRPVKKDTYCLGSQYWAKNPPTPGYKPMYGILLDMVGAKNATFKMEGISMSFAPSVMQKVWNTGAEIGFSDYFLFERTGQIVDDHFYINQLTGIPTIDIIHHDASTESGFPQTWHTHRDRLEEIDRSSLKAVGQTVTEVIFREKSI